MKFVIVGTGAIGGYYGARLCEAGHDVVFVARGPHLDAIKTSMHIDLENGRSLEIDAISGPVIARARVLGISAPVTETVAALLRHKLKIRDQN